MNARASQKTASRRSSKEGSDRACRRATRHGRRLHFCTGFWAVTRFLVGSLTGPTGIGRVRARTHESFEKRYRSSSPCGRTVLESTAWSAVHLGRDVVLCPLLWGSSVGPGGQERHASASSEAGNCVVSFFLCLSLSCGKGGRACACDMLRARPP